MYCHLHKKYKFMFSVGVQWTELERYLSREFNREIIRVPGDGACFI